MPDGADLSAIRKALAGAPVDANLIPTASRRKRLLIADMDSTIVTTETLDEMAAYAGLQEVIAAITKRSMNGEIDFPTALRERVGEDEAERLLGLENELHKKVVSQDEAVKAIARAVRRGRSGLKDPNRPKIGRAHV